MESAKYILLIEDDVAASGALKALLEGQGYGVACAANGLEALDRLQREELPGLILLDLSMPIMNGWEFRDRQRQAPTLAAIPVVLLSAEENLSEVAVSLKAAGFFAKPVEFDDLLEAIRCVGQQNHR